MVVAGSGPAAGGISGSGLDNSAWPGLYTSASGAKNTYLLFDPWVAKAAYDACSTLLGNIETMMNTIQETGPGWHGPLVPLFTTTSDYYTDALTSAKQFREYLVGKWQELDNTLYEHKLIVTKMAETFVEASNNYINNDHHSGQNFPRLDPGHIDPANTDTLSVSLSSPVPDWSTYNSSSGFNGTGTDLLQPDPYAASIADTAEDASGFGIWEFWYIGQSIDNSRPDVQSTADQWRTLQTTWNEWAHDFHTDMQAALASGKWTGEGATAATTAVNNYVNGAVTALGQTLGAMADAITELQSLLNNIEAWTPASNWTDDSLGDIAGALHNGHLMSKSGGGGYYGISDLQTLFNENYKPGLQKVAAVIPLFDDPGTAKPAASGSGSGPATSGPGDPGTSGPGDSGGSGPEGTGPSLYNRSRGKDNFGGSGPGDSGNNGGGDGDWASGFNAGYAARAAQDQQQSATGPAGPTGPGNNYGGTPPPPPSITGPSITGPGNNYGGGNSSYVGGSGYGSTTPPPPGITGPGDSTGGSGYSGGSGDNYGSGSGYSDGGSGDNYGSGIGDVCNDYLGSSGASDPFGSLLRDLFGGGSGFTNPFGGGSGFTNLFGASGFTNPFNPAALGGASGKFGPFTDLGGISGPGKGIGGGGGGAGGGGAGLGGGGLGPEGASGPLSADPVAQAGQFPSGSGSSTSDQFTESARGKPGEAVSEQQQTPMSPGMPMGGMGGMGGQQGQQKERKRSSSLDSKKHLDEAVGEDPLSVRPIIDQ
ncbi:MAG: hypothetical protein J2P17_00295 [Mycobacterium sp.]|nr:hypothetical protein [Mycobacterium sp.]